MKRKIITIVFVALLAAGVIASILVPDKYYSANEKRTLTQFPKITWKRLFAGDVGDDTEDYLSDQFPARDKWVTFKTTLDRLLGKKESNGVYFCDDGYLLAAHTSINENQAVLNLQALQVLQANAAASGIPMTVMLVPTADYVLTDKLPAYAPVYDQSILTNAAVRGGINVIDVTDALRAHADEYIYYKTDHHWTTLGAYYAWAQWKTAKGEVPTGKDAYTVTTLCDDFRGTAFNKVNYELAPYDVMEAWTLAPGHAVSYENGYETASDIYDRSYLTGRDQYGVYLSSNRSQTTVKGCGTGKLLIIKDSFANTFAQFTVDEYEETHMLDLRFYTGSVQKYIADNGITEILVLYNVPNFAEDTTVTRCSR